MSEADACEREYVTEYPFEKQCQMREGASATFHGA